MMDTIHQPFLTNFEFANAMSTISDSSEAFGERDDPETSIAWEYPLGRVGRMSVGEESEALLGDGDKHLMFQTEHQSA